MKFIIVDVSNLMQSVQQLLDKSRTSKFCINPKNLGCLQNNSRENFASTKSSCVTLLHLNGNHTIENTGLDFAGPLYCREDMYNKRGYV